MNLKNLVLPFLLLGAGALPAQTRLIGPARTNCPPPYGSMTALASQVVCKKPDWCSSGLKLPSKMWTGAATWDPNLGAVWMSNGPGIYLYYPSSCTNPCKCLCKRICGFLSQTGSEVTGLALDPRKHRLFVSYENNTIYTFTFSYSDPCKQKAINKCQFSLPSGYKVTGLAYHRFRDLLFITAAKYDPVGNPVSGTTILFASKASDPCKPFCKYQIKNCGTTSFGAATGVTYDGCSRMVYVTDGKSTVSLKYGFPCAFKQVACCPASPVYYYGLALRDSGCKAEFGTSGVGTQGKNPCNLNPPNCAFQPGYSGGLPYAGNFNFKLNFTQGPNPAGWAQSAILLLNFAGHCKARKIPWLCNSTLVLYPLFDNWFYASSAVALSQGTPPCGLKGTFNLPIPNFTGLCCRRVCGQWITFNAKPGTNNWFINLSKEFHFTVGG